MAMAGRPVRWALLAVPVVLLPALAGCTGSPGPRPSPTTSTRADGSRAFGDSFLYGTKPGEAPDAAHALRVAVADLGTYTPSPDAETEGHHAAYRQYRLVVTNTTGETWDLSRFRVVGSDGDGKADTAIDPAKGIGALPPSRLPPGRTVSWTVAFSDDEGFPSLRVVPRNEHGTFPAARFEP
jgi:hypothetical protein